MATLNTQDIIDVIRALPGDFSSVTDSELEVQIDIAKEMYFNVRKWARSGKLRTGLALAVAHLLDLDDRLQNSPGGMALSGAINSLSEGDQSISADTGGLSGEHPDLGRTTYGRMLIKLRRSLPVTPISPRVGP